MTEREKELSKIRKHSYNPPPENLEAIKPKITPVPPRTKKHFPVEELEDIETKIIALGNRLDFMQDSVRRNQEMLNQAMTIHSQLLYIVRGLEKY